MRNVAGFKKDIHMMSYLVVFIEKDDFLKFFSPNTPNFSEGQLPLY